MSIKKALKTKPKSVTDNNLVKSKFPKEKVDGFYHTLHNTNILEMVYSIKNEKIAKQ